MPWKNLVWICKFVLQLTTYWPQLSLNNGMKYGNKVMVINDKKRLRTNLPIGVLPLFTGALSPLDDGGWDACGFGPSSLEAAKRYPKVEKYLLDSWHLSTEHLIARTNVIIIPSENTLSCAVPLPWNHNYLLNLWWCQITTFTANQIAPSSRSQHNIISLTKK